MEILLEFDRENWVVFASKTSPLNPHFESSSLYESSALYLSNCGTYLDAKVSVTARNENVTDED